MKKLIFKTGMVVALVFAFVLYGCKQELPTKFTESPAIYFGTPVVFGASAASTNYSFAKYPNKTFDTVRIPISLLGNPSSVSKEISISAIDSVAGNGIAGKDFKLLPPYIMPAGATQTTIPVVVYRTSKLDTFSINFFLKVNANESFQPGITAQTSWKVSVIYLQKPSTWDLYNGSVGWAVYSTNMGTWTKTKYQVMIAALYNPVADTSITEFPFSRFQPPAIYGQYLQIVKNYIISKYPGNYSTPVGVGATLRDPDANNAVIQVGPANY